MDPVCHTLVGAALARTPLRERTGLASAAFLIGANLPDIDVLALLAGQGLAFRRGWTHGVLALAILPMLLTGILLLWARVRPPQGGPPVRARALFALSALAILTHPFLDFLNTYGMRWLMPFDGTWFYGDAVFIVDPWMWLVLGVGVGLAGLGWRIGRWNPASVALLLTGAYIGMMLGTTAVGRAIARRDLAEATVPVDRLMVGPLPINPLGREVVVVSGTDYRTGRIVWWPSPRLVLDVGEIPRGGESRRAQIAAAHPVSRQFLGWSRFPFFVELAGSVRLDDARYAGPEAPSWAAVEVPLPLHPEVSGAH